jgi:hypothetical protein
MCTRKNDLTRHVTHREAVFGSVIHSIFDAWHYKILWTYVWTRLLWYTCDFVHRILYITLDTIHHAAKQASRCTSLHAPEYALKYIPDCTRWHTPSQLDYTLTSTLRVRSQVHLRVHCQVHSRACTPGCTQLHSMAHSLLAWLYSPK